MRLGLVAERLLDWVALASGRVPTPIIDALPGIVIARALMAAARMGIFDALACRDLPAEGIAVLCQTDPNATKKLLHLLVSQRYLSQKQGRYALTSSARRWLLRDSPQSVRDYLLYNGLQWDWLSRTDAYLRTGSPIRFHQEMSRDEWELYQKGMLAIARLTAPEVAWRIPVRPTARQLLDIGGAHGAYSVALCRRHPHLQATVLDLPEAVEFAAPLLARSGMPDRVRHVTGDALMTELGESQYDLIFMANLAHHFDAATNGALVARIARALVPGGICVIQEGIRPEDDAAPRQFEACGDFFFALTSEAGLYSFSEMAAWQRAAGLTPLRAVRLLTGPGQGLVMARKPQP